MVLHYSFNDTSSMIDVLFKLVLVLVGIAFIIYFCHWLRHNKKRSRTRYKNTDNSDGQLASASSYYYNQSQLQDRHHQTMPPHLLAASHDLYNRLVAYQYLSCASTTAVDAFNNLVGHHTTSTFEAPGSAALVANPVYSAASCYLIPAADPDSVLHETDPCPSYEEAIAAAAAANTTSATTNNANSTTTAASADATSSSTPTTEISNQETEEDTTICSETIKMENDVN